MALSKEEGEVVRNLVDQYGSFVVSLKKTYWLHKTAEEEIRQVRDFIRHQVLTPLMQAATKVIIYGSECIKHEFEHEERKNFGRLMVKKGSSYEIKLENRDAVVHEFPDFWAGSLYDLAGNRHYGSGEVLFLIDDKKLDFEHLFSCFAQLYVVTNLPTGLGRSLLNRAMKYRVDHSDMTAIALYSGTNFFVFPGNDVMKVRLEQAIGSVIPAW